MLDPWNVAGVVLAASKIAWDIVVFWKDLANAPEEAREFGGIPRPHAPLVVPRQSPRDGTNRTILP